MKTAEKFAPATSSEKLITHHPVGRSLAEGLDYYKPTMSQLAYEKEPEAKVTFSLHNRGPEKIFPYLDVWELGSRLQAIREKGWDDEDLEYLSGLELNSGGKVFTPDYIDYLKSVRLPALMFRVSEDNELNITTTGDWPAVSFWETVVMSEVNEMYFENYLLANEINPLDVYEEGDRRLSEKIEILKQHPEIKFADFGTRRHFSYRWQKYVLERLVRECPGNIVGTSNIALAKKLGIKPIGTFAHEMPMVYAALADRREQDIRGSFNYFLDDWRQMYGADYGIALSDTFGSDSFFEDFKNQPMEDWRGLRQDSGDPYEFGEKAIDFYRQQGIDPATKTIVFSDGLDLRKILDLQKHFEGRVNILFGWGTSLTNDLGIPALNIVMKATAVNGTETVKLSDDRGKNMGPLGKVAMYREIFEPASEAAADSEGVSRPAGDAETSRIAVL